MSTVTSPAGTLPSGAELGTGEPEEAGGTDTLRPEALFAARGEDGEGSAPPRSEAEPETPEPAVPAARTALAGFLALAAAGVMLAGLFEGVLPVLAAVTAAAVGVGISLASTRSKNGSLLLWLTLPIAGVAAAIFAAPAVHGGLSAAVSSVVRNGGLSDPPVPFEAGWRFLLVFLLAALGSGVISMAVTFRRSGLAIFVPVAVAFAGLLLQPSHTSPAPTIVALVLIIGSVLVSFGGELAADGAGARRFEVRRIARGLATMAALAAVVTAITQVGALFPAPPPSDVIPPTRLKPPPPQHDHLMFSAHGPAEGPWRLGVLDVYDGTGWRTAPMDRRRLVPASGAVPLFAPAASAVAGQPVGGVVGEDNKTATYDFVAMDLPGKELPVPANAVSVTAGGHRIQFDPRTQTLRVPESKAEPGMRYSVSVVAAPTQEQLEGAPAAPASMAPMLAAPPVPPSVQALIDRAPPNAYTRLQTLRFKLLSTVTASGDGDPSVDVTASRAAQLLGGGTGSPFEITATEAMLARWLGIPSRIGYGFFGGDTPSGAPAGGPRDVFLHHGASWLEVYFQGLGWVPILGQPLKASDSLDSKPKRQSTSLPDRNFALSLYVPVQQRTPALLFELVRFWLLRAIPFMALIALTWWGYPAVLKVVRTARRRRWARRHGPAGRIGAAYAAWRDVAHDMNVGYAALTPIEFLQAVDDDREHRELAWLVTRALWGDLVRGATDRDADEAERLAHSLSRRLRRADNVLNVLIGAASRASLRAPYDPALPNMWHQRRRSRVRRTEARRVRFRMPGGKLVRLRIPAVSRFARPVALGAAVILGLGGSLAVVARSVDHIDLRRGNVANVLPSRLAPSQLGAYSLAPTPAAEQELAHSGAYALIQDARVFRLEQSDGTVIGMIQAAPFKPGLHSRRVALRRQLLTEVGGGTLEARRVGDTSLYAGQVDALQVFAYVPSGGGWFELMLLKRGIPDGERLFADLVAFQHGQAVRPNAEGEGDVRRGLNS